MRTFRDLTEKPTYGAGKLVMQNTKMELVVMTLAETCDECGGALVKGAKAWKVVNSTTHLPVFMLFHVSCARELGLDLAEGVARR